MNLTGATQHDTLEIQNIRLHFAQFTNGIENGSGVQEANHRIVIGILPGVETLQEVRQVASETPHIAARG